MEFKKEANKKNNHKPPSHKGKTYQEIYGNKWQAEAKKRGISQRKHYDLIGRKTSRNKHATYEYIQWRNKVFERDNWICQDCGINGELQAHHRKSWSKFIELRYEIDNGIALCIPCHKKANKVQREYEKQLFKRK